MKRKISLYECMNTAYPTDDEGLVTCRVEHQLGMGNISARQVKRGQPLECTSCQGCKDIDYNKMEYQSERGWVI